MIVFLGTLRSMKQKYFMLLTCLFVISCASRPQLYPNAKLKADGKAQSDRAVEQCLAEADAYLESSKGKQVLKGAGRGAAIGGAIGAVTGLFSGNLARGVVQGAAVGGTAGGVSQAVSPNQLKQRYTEKCLSDQGYQVIGWD